MLNTKRIGMVLGVVLALLQDGCEPAQTMADRGVLAGDVTSCVRNQLVEPPGCQTPPDVYCSRPIEECAAVGCRIDGSGMLLYPDFSWSDPGLGTTGTWSLSRLDGFDLVDLGAGAVLRVDDSGAVIPGCS